MHYVLGCLSARFISFMVIWTNCSKLILRDCSFLILLKVIGSTWLTNWKNRSDQDVIYTLTQLQGCSCVSTNTLRRSISSVPCAERVLPSASVLTSTGISLSQATLYPPSGQGMRYRARGRVSRCPGRNPPACTWSCPMINWPSNYEQSGLCQFAIIVMKRLQEVALEKTLEVEVKCTVNETAIDRNFEVILQCLKDIDGAQSSLKEDVSHTNQRTDKCQKDIQKILRQLATLTGRLDYMRESPTRLRPSAKSGDLKQLNVQLQGEADANGLESLRRRVEEEAERTKKNNIENLKDLNLLLSDVKDIKRRLGDAQTRVGITPLEGRSSERSGTQSDTGHTLQHTRIMQNEMQRQLELINKLFADLQALKNLNENLAEKVGKLETEKNLLSYPSTTAGNTVRPASGAGTSPEDSMKNRFDKYDHALERLDIIQQKLRILPNSNDIDSGMEELKTWIGEVEETVTILQEEIQGLKAKKDGAESKPEATPRTMEVINRKEKQKDAEHENEHKSVRETLAELASRLSDLERLNTREKMEATTSMREIEDIKKGQHGRSDAKDKMLPTINKRNLKLKRDSHYNTQSRDTGSKEHSGVLKDGVESARTGHRPYDMDSRLLDIKSDLQGWLKQLLEARNLGAEAKRDDEMFKELELRVQEVKNALERKADHEGMKKYLTFLEHKINQLFMVLAQPESEDALIARKGWGCLSCAKKLEKYKGRLGEHLNWNNSTHNSYSPPKIGFTQTQTNIRSVDRGRFGNPNDKSLNYEHQHHDT